MDFFDALIAATGNDPGVIMGLIVGFALAASEIVNVGKASLLKMIPSLKGRIPGWVPGAACLVVSVFMATQTLGAAGYPPKTWLLGIILAAALGPFWHDKRQQARNSINGRS